MGIETTGRVVTVIEPTLNPFGKKELTKRLNACGYARVSTDKDEQESSFERQCEYYEQYIKSRPELNYVGLFSDPGITGTSAEKREGFMKMIAACRAGKVDKIFVKSVARFARNTEQALHYIKELKEIGVSIVFESEGIDTLTSGGEILITILAGMAEQESRTISKNIRWAYERKFASGSIVMPTKFFLGYGRDKDNNIVVNPREAVIVKRIFKEFLGGYSTNVIAGRLKDDGILTPGGKLGWTRATVMKILTSIRYTGDSVMGKTYKPDVLSPKRIKNEGQRRQYYIQNSHPAIIDKETFELVQAEYKRRRSLRSHTKSGDGRYSSKYAFSGKLVCGECGAKLRRHKQGYVGGRRQYIDWVCINKRVNKACNARQIRESTVEQAFLAVMRKLIGSGAEFIGKIKENIASEVSDDLHGQIEDINGRIAVLQAEAMRLNRDNRAGLLCDVEYDSAIAAIERENSTLKLRRGDLELQNERVCLAEFRIEDIGKVLSACANLTEFNEYVFTDLVDKITVYPTELKFNFKCGLELRCDRE
jgi:DNA invertase Pin-like site-specific DNA recombinase